MRRWVVASALAAAVGLVPVDALARGRVPVKISGSLNLATATQEQLDLLPGVGPKAAKAIIEYRGRSPFMRVEDLVRVKGFGRKRFQRLRAFLTLTGETTLRVEPLQDQRGK